jgi:hypothetical protein
VPHKRYRSTKQEKIMIGKPTISPNIRAGRYVITTGPQIFRTCDFKSEAEALKAWAIWHSHLRMTRPSTRPGIPTIQDARKRGRCMQCGGVAWSHPTHYGYHTGSKRECGLPHLEACGMNLCAECYAVHQKSLAAGLTPTEEIPFKLAV